MKYIHVHLFQDVLLSVKKKQVITTLPAAAFTSEC